LIGLRVMLRRPRESDVEERKSLGRHPEVVRGFGVILSAPETITAEEAETWVARLVEHSHAWVIEHAGRLIGEVRLDNIDCIDRRASLAAGIYDPQLLGKGFGSESIMLCLNHAFTELKLHRISARVLASNARAIACYRKCGFTEEGREREAARVNGNWEDDVIMGLLDHEFKAS
jgi:RimJ/RimL family protein N-acetyltransferase